MRNEKAHLTAEENLVAAIIQMAIKEECPGYLLDPCGRWWLNVANLDPRETFKRATEGTRWDGKPYEPYARCRGHRLLKKAMAA